MVLTSTELLIEIKTNITKLLKMQELDKLFARSTNYLASTRISQKIAQQRI